MLLVLPDPQMTAPPLPAPATSQAWLRAFDVMRLVIAPSAQQAAEALVPSATLSTEPCTVPSQRAALVDGIVHRKLLQAELVRAELEQLQAQEAADARVQVALETIELPW